MRKLRIGDKVKIVIPPKAFNRDIPGYKNKVGPVTEITKTSAAVDIGDGAVIPARHLFYCLEYEDGTPVKPLDYKNARVDVSTINYVIERLEGRPSDPIADIHAVMFLRNMIS